MKKNILAVVFTGLFLAAGIMGCGGSPAEKGEAREQEEEKSEGQEEKNDSGLLSGKHYVNINIKDKGTIKVELDADSAPISVTNFVNLAKSGFYDGIVFHRIIGGFMMQGGDPTGTGMGGAEEKIKGEFSSNGVENPLSHTRGAISMARSQDPDSASSQFFIVHQDSLFLDGDYAAFGYVIEGMDIVDDICENTAGQDNNGIVPEENRPVIESMEYLGENSEQ